MTCCLGLSSQPRFASLSGFATVNNDQSGANTATRVAHAAKNTTRTLHSSPIVSLARGSVAEKYPELAPLLFGGAQETKACWPRRSGSVFAQAPDTFKNHSHPRSQLVGNHRRDLLWVSYYLLFLEL